MKNTFTSELPLQSVTDKENLDSDERSVAVDQIRIDKSKMR